MNVRHSTRLQRRYCKPPQGPTWNAL